MPLIWVPKEQPERQIETDLGKVCYVFGPDVSPLDVKKQMIIIEREVLPQAKADDFVILIGPTIMTVTLTNMLMHRFGILNLLLWNSREKAYVGKRIRLR